MFNSSVVETIDLRASGNSFFKGGNVGFGTSNPWALGHFVGGGICVETANTGCNPSSGVGSFEMGLGIGTSSPASLLEVKSGTTTNIQITSTASLGTDLILKNSVQEWRAGQTTSEVYRIRDQTVGANPFSIEPGTPQNTVYLDSTGFVGIGLSNPSRALHVKFTGSGSQGQRLEADRVLLEFIESDQTLPAGAWRLDASAGAMSLLRNTHASNPFQTVSTSWLVASGTDNFKVFGVVNSVGGYVENGSNTLTNSINGNAATADDPSGANWTATGTVQGLNFDTTNGIFTTDDTAGAFAPVVTVSQKSTNQVGLRVDSLSSNSAAQQTWNYNGSQAMSLLADGTSTVVAIQSRDFGNDVLGPFIEIGRNSNGTQSSMGLLKLKTVNATDVWIWSDNSGIIRTTTGAGPTGSQETSGTVVGTQTSLRELKKVTGKVSPGEALSAVLATDYYRFRYRDGSYNDTEFLGAMADEAGHLMMDGGRSFSPMNASSYNALAIQALLQMREADGKRIALLEEAVALLKEAVEEAPLDWQRSGPGESGPGPTC
ncbi:MAG: hypothetical protein V3T83_15680 [Acidobacteriota bacterium]